MFINKLEINVCGANFHAKKTRESIGIAMISIQHKFLFIHVPKTGGNSIQNILKDYSEDKIVTLAKHQDGIERFQIRNDKYNITKHSSLAEYKTALEPEIYASLFKFATIRNPWDKMISWYFSPHRGVIEWNRADFIKLVDRVQPFQFYACLNPGAQLDQDIDFVLRFEQLNADFKKLCQKISLPPVELPVRNQSRRQPYSHYYDEELRQIVQSRFIQEIEFGDYDFASA